ncbi:MAG: hypothetical protein ACK4WJ_05425 [Endomicrobiia bacterium]
MVKLTESEKREFKSIAESKKLREDLRKISTNRHNPFFINGEVDIDNFLNFLNEYNQFINHTPKPFKKILARKNVL